MPSVKFIWLSTILYYHYGPNDILQNDRQDHLKSRVTVGVKDRDGSESWVWDWLAAMHVILIMSRHGELLQPALIDTSGEESGQLI